MITGDLKKRMNLIIGNGQGRNRARRLLLVRAGLAVLAAAFVIGTSYAPSSVGAQSRVQEKSLAFDAVSIKPMKDSERSSRSEPGLRFLPGGVESSPGGGVTAKQLIAEAYQLTEHQLSGGPGWISSDLFTLQARTEGNAGRDEIRLMLQAMLSERFNFAASHGKKEMPVYGLIVRNGGPGPIRYRSNPGANSTESTGFHRADSAVEDHTRGRAMAFTGTTMELFARSLSQLRSGLASSALLLDRPVVDRTGLHGIFSFRLAWNDDNDLMLALQDELGLRLESQKAEMDTLVIGHIEKPSAN